MAYMGKKKKKKKKITSWLQTTSIQRFPEIHASGHHRIPWMYIETKTSLDTVSTDVQFSLKRWLELDAVCPHTMYAHRFHHLIA